MQLKQSSNVSTYIKNFEEVAGCIDNLSDDEALHKFVYGLSSSIRQFVLIQDPSTLNEAMKLAIASEDVRYNINPYFTKKQ